MAYQPITTINIGLETTSVSRASFGIPLFITDHVWFPERSRSYGDVTQAADDLPTTSDAYKGVVKAFAQDVSPTIVKVGRREVDEIEFTPQAATAIGQVYTITVVGTDDVAVTGTFTTITGSETATAIATDLATDLATLTGVTVTDNTGSFSLAKLGTDAYYVTNVARLDYVTITTESPEDTLVAISQENDDFYFVASNDHTDSHVIAMAAAIEARTKIYFVALQDVANLAAYSVTATDTMSKLTQNSRFRTAAWYHHEADTTFPEMEYIAVASPADPGKKIWANNRVSGSAAKNVSTGFALSATEKSNLNDKKANYTETVNGIVITRNGYTSAGERINIIRNRDFLEARLNENYQNFLIKSPVVPYTNSGINAAKGVCTSTLDRYVETEAQPNILEKDLPYTVSFPRRQSVSFADVAAGELNASFVGYLSGAILLVKITGTLTFRAAS